MARQLWLLTQKYGQLDLLKYERKISRWGIAIFFEMVKYYHCLERAKELLGETETNKSA